jgi:hypothetical protein
METEEEKTEKLRIMTKGRDKNVAKAIRRKNNRKYKAVDAQL